MPAVVTCPVAGSTPASLCDSAKKGSKAATPVPGATSLIVPPGPPKVTSPKPADVAALCRPCCAKI